VSDNSSLLPHGGDAMMLAKRLSLLVLFMLCFATMTSAPSTASDLTEALKARDVAQVRSLLAAGANVNEKVRGDYPLNIAAVFGPAEMVSVLLEAGSDIEKPGRDGLHPLHNAVISGRTEIVALLLQRGAEVDAKDRQGRTPLLSFAAIAGSNIDIPRRLLAAGADPAAEETIDQLRALDFAAISGEFELVKLLLSTGVDVNHRQGGFWGETALMHAVFHDRRETVRLLIAHGADVNLANKQGQGPMYFAEGKPEMQQLLIKAGAK
jgi:uncharacterized protein